MSIDVHKEVFRHTLVRELPPSTEAKAAWYHHMQETQPVRYRPEYNLWEIFRYKDVEQVLLDYATFSIDRALPDGLQSALVRCDPPKHRQLRGTVSKTFTPRSMEDLTPRLTQIVDELLERACASEKTNLVTELAHPLPIRAIIEVLGLPLEDEERLRQWSSQLLGQIMGILKPDNTELIRYFSDLLNERKRNPRDDFMSGLLAMEENEEHLTREASIYLLMDLLTGGNIATTDLLIFALRHLSQQPETYQALRDDPSLIPGMIEETTRYDFSSANVWRTARHDTVFNGHQIKAGQYVVLWLGATSFDETYFPQPELFDIRRSPNPHMIFAHGVHVCLGAPLVRLETRIALERIVARFPEFRLDPEIPA